MGKKKTNITYGIDLDDAPETVDDLAGEPEPAPEHDPDLLDAITIQDIEQRRALIERRVDECATELHRERMRLVWPTVQDTEGIIARCNALDAECTHLAHGLVHVNSLMALRREFDREETVVRLEAQVGKLEAERDQAVTETSNAKPGRDRKVAAHKLQLIEDELREVRARRDSEARAIPWRSRTKVEAAIRDIKQRKLAPLLQRKAKHEAVLAKGQNDPDYGQAKAWLPGILEEIKDAEFRIETLRGELKNLSPRPRSDNPDSWPSKVLNSANATGILQRVRDKLDKPRAVS